jgi:hypothetical protein
MYYQLTGAVKRRFIEELRNYWKHHPKYPDLADNIQGKYSFNERPQHGMIIKTGSASRNSLSADNFMGSVHSYVTLAALQGSKSQFLEWVRENTQMLAKGAPFPSPPGVYYLEIADNYEFYVDPLLSVYDESVLMSSPTEGVLLNTPIDGTLRVFELPSNQPVEFTRDGDKITLAQPLTAGTSISADYRYAGESRGPFKYKENYSNVDAIPGAILVFGRRVEVGDKMAVIVQPKRDLAYQEYGGKWEMSVDIEVLARDVYAQQEISDQSLVYLWAILRTLLSKEGIEITDVSLGGESEEVYDENGDDYFYNGSLSISLTTEWAIQLPVYAEIKSVSETYTPYKDMQDLSAFGLKPFSDPFIRTTKFSQETIR